ncbi:MAG: PEP-CTERM sorting domain-containing protein, partial [Akkermansiaceae bacterium]
TVAMGSTEFVLDGGMAHGAVVAGNFNVINATSPFFIAFSTSGSAGSSSVQGSFFIKNGRFTLDYLSAAHSNTDFLHLVLGDDVGPSLNFATNVSLPNNFDGYIGFLFPAVDGGDVHYGWVRAVGNADGSQLSLTEYAYESTPGATIQIGQVPEPSSLALLALGAGGLASYRRRKAA